MAADAYLLSLEGGGTRSQAVLMDLAGNVLRERQSSDVNTNFTTFESAQQAVVTAVREVLRDGAVSGAQVRYFVSSLIGPRFGEETFGDLCPGAIYRYFGEGEVVFARAGIYQPHGVALVAATGATSFATRRDTGQRIAFGGWGSLLGDEGSGYAMGLLGLRAAAKAFEGRAPAPTRLVPAICQYMGIPEELFHSEIVRLAYQKPLSRAEIGSLASVVSRLAAEGDPMALRITDKVAIDLRNLAMHAARRMFTREEAFDMVAAGGVINAGDLVLAPLKAALAEEYPRAVFHVGNQPPAVALGRLALDHFSREEEPC